MDAKKFRDEVSQMLVGGLVVWDQHAVGYFGQVDETGVRRYSMGEIIMLMNERANNIAQAYADRVAEEEVSQ